MNRESSKKRNSPHNFGVVIWGFNLNCILLGDRTQVNTKDVTTILSTLLYKGEHNETLLTVLTLFDGGKLEILLR